MDNEPTSASADMQKLVDEMTDEDLDTMPLAVYGWLRPYLVKKTNRQKNDRVLHQELTNLREVAHGYQESAYQLQDENERMRKEIEKLSYEHGLMQGLLERSCSLGVFVDDRWRTWFADRNRALAILDSGAQCEAVIEYNGTNMRCQGKRNHKPEEHQTEAIGPRNVTLRWTT